MISLNKATPQELSATLALRFKTRRLAYGWSREELGKRSGVAVATLRYFEDTGKIAFERLLKLAFALGIMDEFEKIAEAPAVIPVTLDDYVKMSQTKPRERGKTLKPNSRKGAV